MLDYGTPVGEEVSPLVPVYCEIRPVVGTSGARLPLTLSVRLRDSYLLYALAPPGHARTIHMVRLLARLYARVGESAAQVYVAAGAAAVEAVLALDDL